MSKNDDIADLRNRMQRLEDEVAVRDLMMTYCLAADAEGTPPTAAERERVFNLYTEDCVMDIDRRIVIEGRENMASLQRTSELDAICGHVIGPLKVRIAGDSATVTGYTTIYMRGPDGSVSVGGQGYAQWQLEKREGQWRIHRRLSRQSSDPEGKAMFAQAADA